MKLNEAGWPVIADNADFAELMREVHSSTAFHSDGKIAGGNAYKVTHAAFLAAIAIAYPDVPATDIYEVWVDCTETVKYCANWCRNNKLDKATMTVADAIMDMQDISGVYDESEKTVTTPVLDNPRYGDRMM